MRFLVDAQRPMGLAGMLQQHGQKSKHVYDLNMMPTSDNDIGAWAKQSKSIITKDEAFVILHGTDENPCAAC